MGGIGGILGAGSAGLGLFNNIFGSGSQGGFADGSMPNVYQPQFQPQMDQYFDSIMKGLIPAGQQEAAWADPLYRGYATDIMNDPYQSMMQTAANRAGSYGLETLGPQEQGAATTMFGLGRVAAPYAKDILKTAFDPQKQLYDRTENLVSQQMGATNASMGLQGPAAAGVTGAGLENFNIDWQNNLLNREATGAQAYTGLAQGIGSDFSGGGTLGQGAMGTIAGAGKLPYSTALVGPQTSMSALGTAGQGIQNSFGLDEQAMQNILAYLGYGQSGQALAGNIANQQFLQNQALGQSFGQGISGLGNMFGPSSSPFSMFGGGNSYYGGGGGYGYDPGTGMFGGI